jgi:hypothetical protein
MSKDLAHRQQSERVIINSPMSFAGSAQRFSRLVPWGDRHVSLRIAGWVVAALAMTVWWAVIVVWYAVSIGLFWFLTIPYRLLRRGARQRKAQALRHRETLAALERSKSS